MVLKKRHLLYFVVFLLVASVFVLPRFSVRPLKIDFINVGDGDAILIRDPGGQTALIDTGSKEAGPQLADYLREQRISTMDYLILTHGHPDHIGGVPLLCQEFAFGTIYDNGQEISGGPDPESARLASEYLAHVREGSRYGILRSGDAVELGKTRLEVLWPPGGEFKTSDYNLNSLVIRVSYGSTRILLMADMQAASEAELLAQTPDLRADILKVGYHGSRLATGEAFLDRVRPKAAVISAKPRDPEKPHRDVLRQLAKRDITVYRTDQDGHVRFALFPNRTWTVETDRNRAPDV